MVDDQRGFVTLVPLDHDEGDFTKQIEALIAKRVAARQARNFTESDRIRDELLAMGVVLKDSKDGTTWQLAR